MRKKQWYKHTKTQVTNKLGKSKVAKNTNIDRKLTNHA